MEDIFWNVAIQKLYLTYLTIQDVNRFFITLLVQSSLGCKK